jgi:TrmH family RNA methyltransferase
MSHAARIIKQNMSQISSLQNPRLKDLRRLQRRRERERGGRFVVEGEDLVAAAELAGWAASEGYRAAHSDIEVGAAFVEVEPSILAQASSLGSGTRMIGVYEQRWQERPTGPVCVYLHGLSDPGNVGTILRGALAFGVSCVAFGPGCADPYSPKAVRASMGAIFGVALVRAETLADLPGERMALVAHAGESLAEVRATWEGTQQGAGRDSGHVERQTITLLVGAEREGLPEELVAACEHVAHIPIASDSLNAAMAATIAMYEMTRVPTS